MDSIPELSVPYELLNYKGRVIKYLLQGGGGYRPGPPNIFTPSQWVAKNFCRFLMGQNNFLSNSNQKY